MSHFMILDKSQCSVWSSKTDLVKSIPCSMFPRSTHSTFAEKLYQTFKDHKRFSKPKLAKTDFAICHYAGDVCFFISLYCIQVTEIDQIPYTYKHCVVLDAWY